MSFCAGFVLGHAVLQFVVAVFKMGAEPPATRRAVVASGVTAILFSIPSCILAGLSCGARNERRPFQRQSRAADLRLRGRRLSYLELRHRLRRLRRGRGERL